jgi:hypothetical protein
MSESVSKVLKTETLLRRGNWNDFERELLELSINFGNAGKRLRNNIEYGSELPDMPVPDPDIIDPQGDIFRFRMKQYEFDVMQKKKENIQYEKDSSSLLATLLASCGADIKVAIQNTTTYRTALNNIDYMSMYTLMKDKSTFSGVGAATGAIAAYSALTQSGKFKDFNKFVREFRTCVNNMKIVGETLSNVKLNRVSK